MNVEVTIHTTNSIEMPSVLITSGSTLQHTSVWLVVDYITGCTWLQSWKIQQNEKHSSLTPYLSLLQLFYLPAIFKQYCFLHFVESWDTDLLALTLSSKFLTEEDINTLCHVVLQRQLLYHYKKVKTLAIFLFDLPQSWLATLHWQKKCTVLGTDNIYLAK